MLNISQTATDTAIVTIEGAIRGPTSKGRGKDRKGRGGGKGERREEEGGTCSKVLGGYTPLEKANRKPQLSF